MDSSGSILLPFDTVKHSNGFAMDIGSSLAKVVYIDKQDWDYTSNEPRKMAGGLACVRTFMLPIENQEEMLSYIREHCHISYPGDTAPLIYSTGNGCHKYGRQFEKELNVRWQHVAEAESFVNGFRQLCKLMPENELLHDISSATYDNFQTLMLGFENLINYQTAENFTETSYDSLLTHSTKERLEIIRELRKVKCGGNPYAETRAVFPCLLGILGAATRFIKIDADGTSTNVDLAHEGGRLFRGLGTLLTGAQSFEELQDLAEKGDPANVNAYIRDLTMTGGEEDGYSNWPPDFLAFCFGKTVYKNIDEFKKPDLARSVLQFIALKLAHATYLLTKAHDVQAMYICGGFGSMHLVQEALTEEFLFRSYYYVELGERQVHFLKNGHHIGAIGAFIHDSDKQNIKTT